MKVKDYKLAAYSIVLTIILCEIVCRAINFDFNNQERNYQSWPIYYRMPREPVGPIFFRRPGPDTWKGQVLATATKLVGIDTDIYKDEPVRHINYDNEGYRNPTDLSNWKIVIIGDSFVELGHLPYEDLYTTRIANDLKIKVKNIGLSHTGPLSYNYFLDRFGISHETRMAIMVFFEGNDLDDLQDESLNRIRYEETGIRPLRNITPQNSFLLAVGDRLGYFFNINEAIDLNHYFINAELSLGDRLSPVTVKYHPPKWNELDVKTRKALESSLLDWKKISDSKEVIPILVYMPSDISVYNGHLKFRDGAFERTRNWTESDLADQIYRICTNIGIKFINLTPPLRDAIEQGINPLNPIWDTHLNSLGSDIVGRHIAEFIRNSVPDL